MLFGLYGASKIGPTFKRTFTATQASIDLATKVFANGVVPRSVLFVLRATENCYLRQETEIDPEETPTAEVGMLLLKNVYWPLVVETPDDGVLWVKSDGTNGTLFATVVSETFASIFSDEE